MPRKKLGAFRKWKEAWAFEGRRSKYSPRTQEEMDNFMLGYSNIIKKKKQTKKSEEKRE
jgi:hypothetical protein